jgi:hypothetical protein
MNDFPCHPGRLVPDEDEDPDFICALMANSGMSQDEIDEQAPWDCSKHWLSEKEYQRRVNEVSSKGGYL